MNELNLSGWALSNRSLVVYMMIVAVIVGIGSYFSIGRNEDPQFTIKTMVVTAAWPGATLEETSKQVTERIERKLQELPGLDNLRSMTRAGFTTIFIDLKGEVTAPEIPPIWQQVRNDVGDIRHTLPIGTLGPFFNDRFGDTYGIIYGFTADGFSQRELRDHVEDIRSKLLNVPDVSDIVIIGAQDEVIFLEFSMERLAGLGVDRNALLAALNAQNAVRPSGVVHTDSERITIRVSGAFDSEQDILAVNFVSGGRMLRLSDVATVRRGFVDPPSSMFRVNGVPAIGLGIAMRDGGDILALGDNIGRAMAEITADLPLGIEPFLVADQPVTVQLAIGEFMESLWQAIAIILVVSFISLGIRPGLIVALAIPLTLAIVFPIMQAFSIDMQRISLGALIIALALLVDDAMTATDATLTRLAAGDPKEEAAKFAFRTYAFAMLAGTFVTIAGFVPVGFAQSSAGEYTFSLFAVVTIALLVSWVVALVFTPLMSVAILRPPKPQAADAKPSFVTRWYHAFLVMALRLRWITIAVTLAVFVGSILLLPLIPRQFFPSSDRPELLVDLTLPQNASIHASATAMSRLEANLRGDPDIEHWSSYVGQGAIRFYLPLDVQLPNEFFSQAVIITKGIEARERLRAKLEKLLAEDFPDVTSRVSALELGPPVGWPVRYRVSGPDQQEVRRIALQLAQVVASAPNARDVNFDWIEPAREIHIQIDQDEARLLGLTSAAIASAMNTMLTGTTVTQVRDDIYLVNVVARAEEEERLSLETLSSLQVPLPGGRSVALGQFASFSYEQALPLIWRRDRVPTLTVQADITPGQLPETVVADLAPAVAEFIAGLPRGYHVAIGGTVEESAESQASVAAVLPAMLFIMLTVLMMQLRSFARLFIVLSVGPLGLIGVVAALLLSGRPLGFVAILGILALLGIITKNAVILIGQIDAERAAGKTVFDAVVAASTMRFRPIMLTAVSTVLGMIPIAPTIFWGPMAFAIMGGLLVGTVLTLIFLPAVYVAVFGGGKPKASPSTAAA